MTANAKSWLPPKGPMTETPTTQTPCEPGQVRFARTCDGDDFENPGLYLVIERVVGDFHEEDMEGRPYWRCLALHHDTDLDGEVDGSVVEHGETWLVNWTEPWPDAVEPT